MPHDPDAERLQLRANAQKLLDGMTYTGRLRDTGLHDALAAFDAADGDRNAASGALRIEIARAAALLVDVAYTDFLDFWDSVHQRFVHWPRSVTYAFIASLIAWTSITGYGTIVFDQANAVNASLGRLDIVAFSESKARLYAQARRYGFEGMKLYVMDAVPITPDITLASQSDGETVDSKSAALVTFMQDHARLARDYQAIGSVIRNADQVTGRLADILSFMTATRSALDYAIERISGKGEVGAAPPPSLAACVPSRPNDPTCPSSGTYAVHGTVPPLAFNTTVQRIDLFLHASGLNIDHSIPNLVPGYLSLLAYQMRVLGTWLLPALYGTLGAGIFFLRRLLRADLPNPPVERVLTRMVLGGLAGVLVASFWTAPIAEGQNIATLSAFMLAFLFGYSIDIFFRLLDRVVLSIQKQIDSVDPTTPGK